MTSKRAHLRAIDDYLAKLPSGGRVSACKAANDCRLIVAGVSCTCIDCDATSMIAGHEGRRPDFFVAAIHPDDGLFHWVIVEMKTGALSVNELRLQLQAGADILSGSDMPMPDSFEFAPLVLRRQSPHASEQAVLDRRKITFRGKSRAIRLRRCGVRLSECLPAGKSPQSV